MHVAAQQRHEQDGTQESEEDHGSRCLVCRHVQRQSGRAVSHLLRNCFHTRFCHIITTTMRLLVLSFYGHYTGQLCYSWYPQLRSGGLCCSTVLLPAVLHISETVQLRPYVTNTLTVSRSFLVHRCHRCAPRTTGGARNCVLVPFDFCTQYPRNRGYHALRHYRTLIGSHTSLVDWCHRRAPPTTRCA